MEKTIYAGEYGAFTMKLKAVRELSGVTQQELANKLGCTQGFISKCESGELRLDIIQLKSWCEALGFSLSEFVREFESSL
jgi:transcriptional regulator with XRE-family HTH domain